MGEGEEEEEKLDSYFTVYTKVEWTKGLYISRQTLKFLEKITGEKFHNIGCGKDFLDMTPKA